MAMWVRRGNTLLHVASGYRRLPRGSYSYSNDARHPRDVLGVGARCTEAEVKAAFRRKAKRLHPDVNPQKDREAAAEQFKQLESAYRTLLRELRDPHRSHHGDDASHARGHASTAGAHPGPVYREWQEGLRGKQGENVSQKQAKAYLASGAWIGGALRGGVAVGLVVAAWRWFSARSDRRQEELDELEFGARKMALRGEAAERERRELDERLSKRRGRAASAEGPA